MSEIQRPWLVHYDPEVPHSCAPVPRPMHSLLQEAAKRWPDRPAVIFQNLTITYARLNHLSGVLAANLRRQGLKRGDRVAVMLPNTPQAVIAYWGVLRAGGTVVFTNPLYMETEIIHQFQDSGARFLIVLDLLWSKIQPLRSQLPIEKYFVTSISDGLTPPSPETFTKSFKSKNPDDFWQLVGDAGYYGRFGFSAEKTGNLAMPGDCPAHRLLALELVEGALDGARGAIMAAGKPVPGRRSRFLPAIAVEDLVAVSHAA